MILLASDYDGTLAINNEIPKVNLEALLKFKSEGHKFAVVSGRSIEMLPLDIIACDYVIAASGSIIVNDKKEVLKRTKMTKDVVFNVLDIIKRSNAISYEISNGFYASLNYLIDPDEHPYASMKRFLSCFSHLEKDMLEENEIVQISVAFIDDNDVQMFLSKIGSIKEVQPHINGHYIDITSKNASKKNALKYLSEDDCKIITIGDGLNDYEMIKHYCGFAMKNGNPKNYDVACKVVNSFSECIDCLLNQT